MLKFRFAGNLRRHFRQIELNVETAAQGLRLLLAQCPEFKRDFYKTKLRIRMAGDDIHPDQIDFHMNRKLRDGSTVLLAPVIEGSIGTSSPIFSAITMGLLVGAYSSYMAGKVKTSAESDSESDSITNNSFTSADNRVGQGRPVPLLLGEMVVGSNVISLGIDTSNNADWEISIS
ncbi:phage tail protein [Lonsdalea britannica]|uniref:Tail assembly protein n=1 Tax=Lonsdalea britannica TaxID=1082704 RepID=A0AAD0SH70_9GAMM|nr:tail assembly protein [Lonsdalea britannica]AXW87837.1 tail assembly protein [Lonsdalea britannica]OSM95962.1 phage tail protein [Lonsdalea britannica]